MDKNKTRTYEKKSILLFLTIALTFINILVISQVIQTNAENQQAEEVIIFSSFNGNKDFSLKLTSSSNSHILVKANDNSPEFLTLKIIAPALDIDISLELDKICTDFAKAYSNEYCSSIFYDNGKYTFMNDLNYTITYNVTITTADGVNSYQVVIVHNFKDFSLLFIIIGSACFLLFFSSFLIFIKYIEKRDIIFGIVSILVFLNNLMWLIISFYWLVIHTPFL
jgi:hypothetical protein